MRRPKSAEERVAALERMQESIHQLQIKRGPYYERWLENYTAWRERRAGRV